jgi:hypothetical protein
MIVSIPSITAAGPTDNRLYVPAFSFCSDEIGLTEECFYLWLRQKTNGKCQQIDSEESEATRIKNGNFVVACTKTIKTTIPAERFVSSDKRQRTKSKIIDCLNEGTRHE